MSINIKDVASRIVKSGDEFFFRPASVVPLAVLRIGLAAALIYQALLVSPLFFEIYGKFGIMQGPITNFFSPGLPNVSHVLRFFAAVGIAETNALILFGFIYLACLGALLLGFHTRIAAAASWFVHLMLAQCHTTSYGADIFANIFLFYLIWMPSGNALSLDHASGRKSDLPSELARFSIRMLQIHLCLVYFSSGLDKAAGPQWWNGEAIWRSMMLPTYAQMDMSALVRVPWLATLLGWGTLLVEIGYPFFIFPMRTRRLWVALTIGMHVGIIIFMGLHVFGFVMALFTASMFGLSAEPRLASVRSSEPIPESTNLVVSH